ncbi:MAG: hypothetical protein F4X32_01210 [Candidatus Dadabacteria bacterium]|nr:hypothetical protein [Candidatus Dadabacteria bacterium]
MTRTEGSSLRFKARRIFLSVLVGFLAVFSFSAEAEAHEFRGRMHSTDLDIDARDITSGNAEDIKKLVLHVAKHYQLIEDDANNKKIDSLTHSRENSILSRETRTIGIFNNGDDIYPIGVTHRQAISSHGKHAELYGVRYNSSEPPFRTLLGENVPAFLDDVDPVCVTYDDKKTACAVRQTFKGQNIYRVAGFDHAKDEEEILMFPQCESLKSRLATTAKHVEDETNLEMKKELLKKYVKELKEIFLVLQTQKTAEAIRDGVNPRSPLFGAEVGSRVHEVLPCFLDEIFTYRTIYFFIMDAEYGVVLINMNDFDLNGTSVDLEDPDPIPYDDKGNKEPNILVLFQKVLTKGTGNVPEDLEDGYGDFVQYHWDNPLNDEDDVDSFFLKRQVPGTSLKTSYIELFDATRGVGPRRQFYVIGSGVYPDDNDKGCAIASVDSAPRSTLLNLFLIASVLFPVAFLKKRIWNSPQAFNRD